MAYTDDQLINAGTLKEVAKDIPVPLASADNIGGVKIGRGLKLYGDGFLAPDVSASTEHSATTGDVYISDSSGQLKAKVPTVSSPSWSGVSDKPFDSVDTSGALSITGGALHCIPGWEHVQDKPFDTIGNGLATNDVDGKLVLSTEKETLGYNGSFITVDGVSTNVTISNDSIEVQLAEGTKASLTAKGLLSQNVDGSQSWEIDQGSIGKQAAPFNDAYINTLHYQTLDPAIEIPDVAPTYNFGIEFNSSTELHFGVVPQTGITGKVPISISLNALGWNYNEEYSVDDAGWTSYGEGENQMIYFSKTVSLATLPNESRIWPLTVSISVNNGQVMHTDKLVPFVHLNINSSGNLIAKYYYPGEYDETE